MKIYKSTYDGYLWYSDQSEPIVLNKCEFELDIDDSRNPFVVEGHLYDYKNNRSTRIRYVDGHYIYKTYDLNSLMGESSIDIFYPSSKRFNGKKLRFSQYWREGEPDSLLEGMKVLEPKEYVFIGFEEKEY